MTYLPMLGLVDATGDSGVFKCSQDVDDSSLFFRLLTTSKPEGANAPEFPGLRSRERRSGTPGSEQPERQTPKTRRGERICPQRC